MSPAVRSERHIHIERGINSQTIRKVVKLAGVLKVAPSKIVVRMEQLLASDGKENH